MLSLAAALLKSLASSGLRLPMNAPVDGSGARVNVSDLDEPMAGPT